MGKWDIGEFRLGIVTWNDAAGSATKVYEEKRDHQPTVMHTGGWIIKNDEAGISIACEWYLEEDQLEWRGHTFIPRAMVISMAYVTKLRMKKL
jgi:hypothetical protein